MSDPDTDVDETRRRRVHIFSRSTAVLEQDHTVPGAEGIFDQALTNGLLVIGSALLGEEQLMRRGRLLPASGLLSSLRDAFRDVQAHDESAAVDDPVAAGAVHTNAVVWLRTGEREHPLDELFRPAPRDRELLVELRVEQLEDALRRTQGVRHGRRADGAVTHDDVDALVLLDWFPMLRALSDERIDADWRDAQVADLRETARAATYFDLLDEDEVERRAESATYQLAPRPGNVDPIPQECPVCAQDALTPTGGDDFGYGMTAGICLVCSYVRSDRIAYDQGMELEWQTRWAHI